MGRITVADSVGPHAFLTLRSGLVAFDPAAPVVGEKRSAHTRSKSRRESRSWGMGPYLQLLHPVFTLGLLALLARGFLASEESIVDVVGYGSYHCPTMTTLTPATPSDSDGAGAGLGAAAAIAAAAAAGTSEARRLWLSGPGVIIGHSRSSGRRRRRRGKGRGRGRGRGRGTEEEADPQRRVGEELVARRTK